MTEIIALLIIFVIIGFFIYFHCSVMIWRSKERFKEAKEQKIIFPTEEEKGFGNHK